MSRQRKQQQPELPCNEQLEQERQQHHEQLMNLHAQLEEYQQERNELVQSRNYAIIVAVIGALAVYYLLFIKLPEDNVQWQQDQVARKMASHREETRPEPCPPDAIAEAVRIKPNQAVTDATTALPWRDKKEITRMLHLWAVAWELKDLPSYFSYYAENYDPQDIAGNIQEWKAKRSYYINRPASIRIRLSDFEFQHLDTNTATVSFNQYYETPEYRDNTHKMAELVKENGRWLILREYSITTQVNLKRQ